MTFPGRDWQLKLARSGLLAVMFDELQGHVRDVAQAVGYGQ